MAYRTPVNRIPPEVEQQILDLGIKTSDGSHRIAAAAGVSQTTVLRVWRRHKIDREAVIERNALVEQYRSLAHRIARSVASGLPFHMRDDLPAVADVALIEAAGRFDKTLGVPFPAFMQQRVRGACVDSIRRRHYTNSNGAEFSQEASEQRVDDASPDAEEQAIHTEESTAKRQLAASMIQSLPGRQAVLLWLHYIEGQTLETIAPKFGVVASRVSQLHREAISTLRKQEHVA